MTASTLRSILVLDDSDDLLELVRFFVERLCERTAITARNLREIEALGVQVFSCELAILDINLGPLEPSGVDVYHWLRSKGFKAPIFFLTGHARSCPFVAEAERLGDARVLTKPLAPDDLIKIIRGEA